MKQKIIYIFTAILIGLVLGSCSDIKNDITQPSTNISVHKDGIMKLSSPNFHGNLIINAGWSMELCWQCHASNYTGGITGVSCLKCHTQPAGPEACNTCHGQFRDPSRIAPPRDTNGDTTTTKITVGAHTSHLYANNFGHQVECQSCHTVPSSVYQDGHLNPTAPGGIIFHGLAVQGGANPQFDQNAGTCANTYCHGNFVILKDTVSNPRYLIAFEAGADSMVGNKFSPDWTKVDGSQMQCGTCHGLPPQGHIAVSINDCVGCHSEVVNSHGEIINPDLHMNGKVDVDF